MFDFGNRIKSGNAADVDEEDDLFSSGKDTCDEEAGAEEPQTEFPGNTPVREKRKVSLSSRRSSSGDDEPDKEEAARILEEARTRMGLSPQEVENVTKIRASYIIALEQCRYEDLPQSVYILAYLRRLCELYALSADEEEAVIMPWSDIQCEIPDNYGTSVYGEECGDNRKIIRRIEITIFSVVAIAIIALVVFGVILLVSVLGGSDGKQNVVFNEADIVSLQVKPVLQIPE